MPSNRTFTEGEVTEVGRKWEEASDRQKLAINRLLGIIDSVREIVNAQAESPEQKLQKVKDILP